MTDIKLRIQHLTNESKTLTMPKEPTSTSQEHHKGLFKFLNTKQANLKKYWHSTAKNSAIVKLNEYLKKPNYPSDTNPIEFWNHNSEHYQEIREISQQVLIVQG